MLDRIRSELDDTALCVFRSRRQGEPSLLVEDDDTAWELVATSETTVLAYNLHSDESTPSMSVEEMLALIKRRFTI